MAVFDYKNINEINIEIEDESLVSYVQNNFNPQNVFAEYELAKWAKENGYVKEGETDE